MPRPATGPYRSGRFYQPTHRTCDKCKALSLRAEGSYVETSRLTMIWCCAACTQRLTAAGMRIAA